MRRAAFVVVIVSMVGLGVPARTADGDVAQDLERVAGIPFLNASHFEFTTRGDRHYVLSGSRDRSDAGLRIIDVTQPEDPQVVVHLVCNQGNNDVSMSPSGDWLVMTSDSNFSGGNQSARGCVVTPQQVGFQRFVADVGLVDIRDIENPVLLGTPNGFPPLKGIHTVKFHPHRELAYLANQELPDRGPTLSILDLEGDTAAVHIRDMPPIGSGPHEVWFNPEGTRAYVGAVTGSYILNTEDPLNPTLVSVIVDPTINIHHETILAPNGRHLFIVDELAGAIASPQCPGGGVHVYDLFDDRVPVKVGVFHADIANTYVPDVAGSLPVCTAHEGNFTPDGTRLSLGWYWAGARVFDTSAIMDPDLPPGTPVGALISEIASYTPSESYMWAAKMHPNLPGYVFGHNGYRGLEVYRFVDDAA